MAGWGEHPTDYRDSQLICGYSDIPLTSGRPLTLGHIWYYGRCLSCARTYLEGWESQMPGLDQVLQGAKTTWADQVQKEEIEGTSFWIHNATESQYTDDQGRDVHLIVCDITVQGPSRKDPRAVITFGMSEERAPMLAYFAGDGQKEPIGPCITYKVGMKGGQSFWRLEPAPDPDDAESFVQFQPSENGGSRSRRR